MGVLGIDGTPFYNQCDPDLLEKSKLKTLLHKAIADGKSTGKLKFYCLGFVYVHFTTSARKIPKQRYLNWQPHNSRLVNF